MFQENEVINLILALISILMFVFIFKKMMLPRLRLLYIGFGVALLFTVRIPRSIMDQPSKTCFTK